MSCFGNYSGPLLGAEFEQISKIMTTLCYIIIEGASKMLSLRAVLNFRKGNQREVRTEIHSEIRDRTTRCLWLLSIAQVSVVGILICSFYFTVGSFQDMKSRFETFSFVDSQLFMYYLTGIFGISSYLIYKNIIAIVRLVINKKSYQTAPAVSDSTTENPAIQRVDDSSTVLHAI